MDPRSAFQRTKIAAACFVDRTTPLDWRVRHSSSVVGELTEADLSSTTRRIFRSLLSGERWALAKAITLIESSNLVK
jgi:hypothetical protein